VLDGGIEAFIKAALRLKGRNGSSVSNK
jgi:hypothetical protein